MHNKSPLDDLNTVSDLSFDNISISSNTGFQASHIDTAAKLMHEMEKEEVFVILAFTGNIIATGLRGIIKELVKLRFPDAIITTGGAIDHDFIRCFERYYVGRFNTDDRKLHTLGINRIGNIFVPNSAYITLEKRLKPILKNMYKKKSIITPSALAKEMGKHATNDSFLYWAYRNNIPVYSPGLIDSAIGLQMAFFKQSHADFILDVVADMLPLGTKILEAEETGALIIGGGISKHHTIASNIIRGGLDYAVYVSTAIEQDGSLSGAKTNEAISWGKIKEESKHVNIWGEATTVLPLLIKRYIDTG